MELFIVRHGQARSNLEHPSQCTFDEKYAEYEARDCSLTPQGELQADLCGKRLSEIKFDAAYSSPMHRALSTAAGVLRHQSEQIPLQILPDLIEVWQPRFYPMPKELLDGIYPNIIPSPEPSLTGWKCQLDDEAKYDMFDRAERVAVFLKNKYKGDEKVLVVSHCGFVHLFLIQALLEIPRDVRGKYSFGIDNASITRLIFAPDGRMTIAAVGSTDFLGDSSTCDQMTMISSYLFD